MNSRRKNVVLVMTDVLVGTMFTDPAVHAAEEYLKAYRSSQAIYFDGQQRRKHCQTGSPLRYIYFPAAGFFSTIKNIQQHQKIFVKNRGTC